VKLSPILTPSGEPIWSAGGQHAWRTFEHRGYVVSLEWVGNHRSAQKCMVIWPASNVFVAGSSEGMWVIGARAITQFVGFNRDDKCTGSVSEHCQRECREALPLLGKDRNDKSALNALMDAVIRFAPDLVGMPAVPAALRREMRGQAMWEVVASNKATGKTLSEASV
jgi:hypothetical protein